MTCSPRLRGCCCGGWPPSPSRWTLEAAREVTGFTPLEPGQVPGLLAGLVDASMVQLQEAAGAGRFRLLETIRAYAA